MWFQTSKIKHVRGTWPVEVLLKQWSDMTLDGALCAADWRTPASDETHSASAAAATASSLWTARSCCSYIYRWLDALRNISLTSSIRNVYFSVNDAFVIYCYLFCYFLTCPLVYNVSCSRIRVCMYGKAGLVVCCRMLGVFQLWCDKILAV